MDRLEEIKRDIREKLANGSPFVSLTIGDAVDLLSCIEAAEAVVEAARRLKGDIGYHDDTPLGDALAAYDKLKGGADEPQP